MPKAERTPKNWAKDSILVDQIIKALDVTEDQSDLVFTVSVQGHGKYPTEQVLEDPAITVKSCPDEEYHYAMEYYVNQIHEMCIRDSGTATIWRSGSPSPRCRRRSGPSSRTSPPLPRSWRKAATRTCTW